MAPSKKSTQNIVYLSEKTKDKKHNDHESSKITQKLSHHDRFVKGMMEDPRVAQEFFDAHLPKEIADQVDLGTLQLLKDTFIEDHLRMQQADLVFEVSLKNQKRPESKGYLKLLCEHQSRPEKLLPLRLLKYMIAIQEAHIKKYNTKILPLVYPIVIYGGKKKYPYTMDFFKLFGEHEDLARHIWSQPFQLVDLSQIPEEELKPYLFFGTMAHLMKHIRDTDILQVLEVLIPHLKEIEKKGDNGYIIRIVSYIFEASNVAQPEDIVQVVATGLKGMGKETIMTLADRLRQEGMEKGLLQGMEKGILQGMEKGILQGMEKGMMEGMEKGRQRGIEEGFHEGISNVALTMMKKQISLESISELTGLSIEQIKDLAQQSG